MKKIGLFYWPLKGNVEKVALAIKERFNEEDIDVVDLRQVKAKHFFYYDNIILGSSTVGADHWEDASDDNKWYILFHEMDLDKVDLVGKNIAIYGLGDQVNYPNNFVDGMDRIYSHIKNHNINLIGEWPNDDSYTFNHSEALHNNKFRGLALDLDNDEDTMDEKIDKWLGLIKPLFK